MLVCQIFRLICTLSGIRLDYLDTCRLFDMVAPKSIAANCFCLDANCTAEIDTRCPALSSPESCRLPIDCSFPGSQNK